MSKYIYWLKKKFPHNSLFVCLKTIQSLVCFPASLCIELNLKVSVVWGFVLSIKEELMLGLVDHFLINLALYFESLSC